MKKPNQPVPISHPLVSLGQIHIVEFNLSVESVLNSPVSTQLKKPSNAKRISVRKTVFVR